MFASILDILMNATRTFNSLIYYPNILLLF